MSHPGPAGGDRPLRILHVDEVHWGGVVTLLHHFVEQQVLAGHDVHLLAPAPMPTWPGVHQHTWSVERGRPRTFLPALRELRRTVAAVRPDVIHLHSFVAGLLGRLPGSLSWSGRVPVVYQPHAWSTDLFTRRALSWGVGATERAAAKHTDVLVANCQDEVDRGRDLGVTVPGRPLGVAVDLARFHPVDDAERRHHREALGVGSDQRVLLVLGRIARQKGQDLLLPEWERSRPERTLLALVGPGDPQTVAGLAPTQWGQTVRAFGEPEAVLPWLWAADALVLSSRYETVGLVVAEAMATGLPVVATNVDGARETLTGGDIPAAGAVVDLADMRSLLSAAGERLADRELWERESMAGRQRAEAMFRPEVVASRLEAAYREAITIVERDERR